MEYFFNEKRVKEMMQNEMLSTGKNIDLNKFTFPPLGQMGDFPCSTYVHDAETLEFLALNKHALKVSALESAEELEHKDIFYMEELRRKQHPDAKINFSHKITGELENALSVGETKLYSGNPTVQENGFCVVRPCFRIPLYKDKKASAVFVAYIELTKNEHAENLYKRYKEIYKDDMKKGIRLFMEYLGLPTSNFLLTDQEINVLISFTKHRTNVLVARELDLAEGTISSYTTSIKNRLHNQNMDDILQHFIDPDRRKF